MSEKFRRAYTNALFRGKMMFSIESWEGANETDISTIQKFQEKTAEIALKGKYGFQKKSARQKHNFLNWLPVRMEIELATQNQDIEHWNSSQFT